MQQKADQDRSSYFARGVNSLSRRGWKIFTRSVFNRRKCNRKAEYGQRPGVGFDEGLELHD